MTYGAIALAPLLVCHELAGGVQPPTAEGEDPAHDLVFFVIAGRKSDGTEIRQAVPNGGGHLKIENQRKGMFVKNTSLWKDNLKDGESVTLILSVREQDEKDSAESDLADASEVVKHVDASKSLTELSHLPVHEILHGAHGDNDHIGTIVLRIKNEKGNVTLDSQPGADVRYLKGHRSNHETKRAYRLNGNHSEYELHLSVGE